MDTIIHYITLLSPYVCGFWAVFFMFINHKQSKDYFVERGNIRRVLLQKYDIDLDKDVLSELK